MATVWEYKILVLDFNKEDLLNETGQEGWELVSVTPEGEKHFATAYLKRPKK